MKPIQLQATALPVLTPQGSSRVERLIRHQVEAEQAQTAQRPTLSRLALEQLFGVGGATRAPGPRPHDVDEWPPVTVSVPHSTLAIA